MEGFKCGICGYLNKNNITDDNTIFKMTMRLTNNINGNTDVYINDNIAFGYSNSNLGDKNKISQPFSRIIDGIKYTIVFNGRIYNKDEIKEKLENMQCNILTYCDAELALILYAKLGNEFLDLLDGAFSLAIYNNKDASLLIITHYPRILEYIKPDFVHVMMDGKIQKTGTIDLAFEVEKDGYVGIGTGVNV